MSIANMLEYQKIDRELYYMEKEFSNSPEILIFSQIQNNYKEKLDSIPKQNKELDEINAQLSELLKRLDNLEKNNSNFNKELNDFKSLEDFEEYEKSLTSYEDEINFMNRETSRLIKKISDIANDNKKVQEQIEVLQSQGNQVRRAFIAKQQEMRIKAAPIVKKLQELLTDINPAMLAKYKACRDAKTFPVFVLYTDEGNCSACGMFVKIEVDKHLKNSEDYVECPHCRRILYKA